MPPESVRVVIPKVKFTPEEDLKLTQLIEELGTRDWETIADEMGHRTARQCRERWNNYLSPNSNTGPWSEDEDKLLIDSIEKFGTKWTKISQFFPNRTANIVRNRYKQLLRKGTIKKEEKVVPEKKQEAPVNLALFNYMQLMCEAEMFDPIHSRICFPSVVNLTMNKLLLMYDNT